MYGSSLIFVENMEGCIHFNILSIFGDFGTADSALCEFAVGRASQKSMAQAYEKLEQKGSRFHHMKWLSIVGFIC